MHTARTGIKLKNDKCLLRLWTAFQLVLIVFLLWWHHILFCAVSLSRSLAGGFILIPRMSLITGKQFSREKCVYLPVSRRIHTQTYVRKLLNFIYSSMISFVRWERWSVCPICSIIPAMKNIACYYNPIRVFGFFYNSGWLWSGKTGIEYKNIN